MSNHIKRLTIPNSWKIPKKENVWAVKPSPGKHPIEQAMPLGMVIRDMLHYADTMKEARRIIGAKKIYVDGSPETDYKAPVGLMDVISIPDSGENYRMLFDARGRLTMTPIDSERAKWKLCSVYNKTSIRGGKTQINLHDGRNIIVDKDVYRTGDVLKISLPEQKIIKHLKMEEGNRALVIGGRHRGSLAVVSDYEVIKGPHPNIVRFKEGFETIKDNVFVVGTNVSEIKLPEADVNE